MTELYAIVLMPGFLLLVTAAILLRHALLRTAPVHGTPMAPFPSAKMAEPSAMPHDRRDFMLDNVTESVICLDREWRYTYLNDAALCTNPAGKESCLGRTIWEVHPETRSTSFFDFATQTMEGRKVSEFEYYYLPMDRWFGVRLYPTDEGLIIFRKDISAEKRALHRPAADVTTLAPIMHSCSDSVLSTQRQNILLPEAHLVEEIIDIFPGIFYMFTRDGRILRWNSRLEKVSGYTPEDIRRMTPFDFVPASEHAFVREKMDTVFEMGEDVAQLSFTQKSGATTPYFFSGKAIMYEGEACLLGVGIDCSEKVRTQEEIRAATNDLKELSLRLWDIRNEERTAIARDIHDDLGQLLTAIKLSVLRLEDRVAGNSGASEIIQQIDQLAGIAIDSIRRISTGLRPEILDDMGLERAIKWQAEEFERRFSIPVTLLIVGANEINDPVISSNCLRILQEALTNIARHASASAVEVNFSAVAGSITLLIRDDGKGLDPDSREGVCRLGLRGIKERAAAIGGKLTIGSDRGAGTRIRMDIPVYKI